MRMKCIWMVAMVLPGLTGSARAAELRTPKPPKATVVGTAGTRTVCYWVFAESAEKADGAAGTNWYLKGMPGKVTDLSAPCVEKNAPDTLDARNKVVLSLQPVAGAAKYHVLRTELLPAPTLTFNANKAPGKDALYYWVQGHNGWRNSPSAGPFKVLVDRRAFDLQMTVVPAAGQRGAQQWCHSIWVTETPKRPLGRKGHVVAHRAQPHHPVGPTARYTGKAGHSAAWGRTRSGNDAYWLAAWGPAPWEPTPASARPVGTGRYLIASTKRLTVEDAGLEAKSVQPPMVNETVVKSFAQRLAGPQSNRAVHNGTAIDCRPPREAAMAADFYAGFCPLELSVRVDRGGKNYYYNQPAAYPGYKSTLGIHQFSLRSSTESQHVVGRYALNCQGMGDGITLGLTAEYAGGQRDQGDVSGELVRASTQRMLLTGSAVLNADAPKGTRHLPATGRTGSSGTGRMLINLSRARGEGRVDRVVNCDVFGDGTGWSRDLVGWFMSMDVENVKQKRSWFQVTAVLAPGHLRLMRFSSWRGDINLGYSRFIYNPAKGRKLPSYRAAGYTYGGPEPAKARETLYTNPLAIGVLPKALEPAAAEGKYLLAPGTYFADPWNENVLHVEPLAEHWKKGDKLELACGTGQSMTNWYGIHWGELGANDRLDGLTISSFIENRPANGRGLAVSDMGIGVQVTLPPERQGNGVIVVGEPVDGAFIAAPDVPMLRCYHSRIPFVQGSRQRTALEIVAPTGERPLSVSKDRVTINGVLRGSDRTRGEARFSGDGKRTSFAVAFAKPFSVRPIVLMSGNQFARSRLASVDAKGFTVEFEAAPKAGKDNVTLWWMAQE